MHNPSGTKATMEKSGGDHALGCIEVMGYASLLTVASGYSIGDYVEITVRPSLNQEQVWTRFIDSSMSP